MLRAEAAKFLQPGGAESSRHSRSHGSLPASSGWSTGLVLVGASEPRGAEETAQLDFESIERGGRIRNSLYGCITDGERASSGIGPAKVFMTRELVLLPESSVELREELAVLAVAAELVRLPGATGHRPSGIVKPKHAARLRLLDRDPPRPSMFGCWARIRFSLLRHLLRRPALHPIFTSG